MKKVVAIIILTIVLTTLAICYRDSIYTSIGIVVFAIVVFVKALIDRKTQC